MKDPKKLKLVILLFAGIIVVMMSLLLFNKPVSTSKFNEKFLQDSIVSINKQLESLKIKESKLERAYDSLLVIEPTIKYRTYEKIKFIFNTSDPSTLDSIIRSNWKTSSRYK